MAPDGKCVALDEMRGELQKFRDLVMAEHEETRKQIRATRRHLRQTIVDAEWTDEMTRKTASETIVAKHDAAEAMALARRLARNAAVKMTLPFSAAGIVAFIWEIVKAVGSK